MKLNADILRGFFGELHKQASWLGTIGRKKNMWETMAPIAGTAAATLGLAVASEMIAEDVTEWKRKKKFEKAKEPAFQKMLEVHPGLRDFPFDKVMLYWEHLYRFAPTLAGDPLAAGAYIIQSLEQFEPIGGPPHDTVGNLVSIEGTVEDMRSGRKPGFKAMKAFDALGGASGGGGKIQVFGNKTYTM
ncbi:hypothetical protein H8D85_01635 [bacterium]|nr:hypothetical protein [bacterium]